MASRAAVFWLARSRETAEQYERWAAPFRENPLLLQSLLRANRLLRVLCYVLYPVLLAASFLEGMGVLAAAGSAGFWGSEVLPPAGALFWRVLVGPAIGFALETGLRAKINAPRPYEALAIDPLIKKDTKGKSFPSRHAFSIFVIATCWLAYSPWIGVALMLAGVVLGWIRVLGGVHYPRDVVAGAALGIVVGLMSCFVL